MRHGLLWTALLVAAVLSSGCALSWRKANHESSAIQLLSHAETNRKTIYIVGHGWHTGLVLSRSDVSPDIWPEVGDFDGADFVEIGWGDEGFYRAKKITAPLVLRAAFWPTPSVLHVASFQGPVEQFYLVSDIVELELGESQFEELCRFLSRTFARDEAGQPIRLGPGIYGDSLFYRARGKYYFPKTCNIWTAKALKAGGLTFFPSFATTAENLLFQSRMQGRVLQESPDGLKKAALLGTE